MKKRILSIILCGTMFVGFLLPVSADEKTKAPAAKSSTEVPFALTSKSAILMEKTSGKVLVEKNPDEKLPPASVTKVMTLLLAMRAIDSGKIKLDDVVTVSEYAASMGGSQVYLEPGEKITVNELLKAITVASGNDAAVALAEYISGSIDVFVQLMNDTAKELGMENTHFANCTGLDDPNHYSSARDIAIMSCELLKHDKIKNYTLIWMDTLRNGKFGLSNTNKLIKSYNGITGLKTGSTSTAKFCVSASAMRDNMELIAVVLAAPTSKERFADASKLLDYGFASYSMLSYTGSSLSPIKVLKGKVDSVGVKPVKDSFTMIVKKGSGGKIESKAEVSENIVAPVENNQKVGILKFYYNNEEIGQTDIVTTNAVKRESFMDVYTRLFSFYIMTK